MPGLILSVLCPPAGVVAVAKSINIVCHVKNQLINHFFVEKKLRFKVLWQDVHFSQLAVTMLMEVIIRASRWVGAQLFYVGVNCGYFVAVAVC